MARLLLRRIEKRYGAQVAVRALDLEVCDGEFVALVGPSGCGKSTTLRMVAGLTEISAGDLYIGDRKVNDVPPKERNIAMVFQSYALYPHMTVYENLSFGLRMQGLARDEIDRRVRGAAAVLGIASYLDRRPKALSGGERQRVAMGRAIVRRPAVFLFDEPLSNLDAKLRVQMRAEIARIHRRQQATTLYVTHDQIEAMTLADRIVVLNRGEVQQVGAPLVLYTKPANRFVAGFLGSPAMNFLEGSIAEGKIACGPWRFPVPAAPRQLPERLVLGARPEALSITADGHLPARVDLVEPIGAEAFVTVTSPDGTQTLVVRCPSAAAPALGAEIRMGIDPSLLHLFEPGENGRALN